LGRVVFAPPTDQPTLAGLVEDNGYVGTDSHSNTSGSFVSGDANAGAFLYQGNSAIMHFMWVF
jgi:hypothetical protein